MAKRCIATRGAITTGKAALRDTLQPYLDLLWQYMFERVGSQGNDGDKG